MIRFTWADVIATLNIKLPVGLPSDVGLIIIQAMPHPAPSQTQLYVSQLRCWLLRRGPVVVELSLHKIIHPEQEELHGAARHYASYLI